MYRTVQHTAYSIQYFENHYHSTPTVPGTVPACTRTDGVLRQSVMMLFPYYCIMYHTHHRYSSAYGSASASARV